MKSRHQRMFFIGIVGVCMLASVAFAFRAFQENLLYYFDPTQVAEGEAPLERRFRLGGMVLDGSVQRTEGTMLVDFVVTDYAHSVPVRYDGILPDLFGEGQGVVIHGTMNDNGQFVADRLLAKHDENYMAPEVAESLQEGKARAGLD